MLQGEALDAFRQSIIHPRSGKALLSAVATLEAKGKYEIGGKTRKLKPRGFDADPDRAGYLLYEGLYAHITLPPDTATKPKLVGPLPQALRRACGPSAVAPRRSVARLVELVTVVPRHRRRADRSHALRQALSDRDASQKRTGAVLKGLQQSDDQRSQITEVGRLIPIGGFTPVVAPTPTFTCMPSFFPTPMLAPRSSVGTRWLVMTVLDWGADRRRAPVPVSVSVVRRP